MHPAAFSYIVKQLLTIGIGNKRILEIGSLDVNSTEQGLSIRALCSDAEYVGIDERDGPGVDILVSAADYNGMAGFDLCISTEALEHTPRPEDILECAWRSLQPGGALLITAAGPDRQPHNCDGTPWSGLEHYTNINPDQLSAWLDEWDAVEIQHNPGVGDVYARATKSQKVSRLRKAVWIEDEQPNTDSNDDSRPTNKRRVPRAATQGLENEHR